jgi:serine/threonine-protein kinase
MNVDSGQPGGAAFEELALRQGLVTPEQLEECRRVRQNVLAQGLECSLEEVLLKKGYLNRTQAAALHASLGHGNRNAIEGFEILAKLGAGGQGAVYKAKQSSLDRLVAIKVLLPKYAKEKDGVHRFLREARALAKLNHPHIVSGIDAGFSNGIYYYVMEYVEGEGLDRRIARLGKLPWREAAAVLRGVGAALEHARQNDLIHRDIKPANILLAKDGSTKVMDLGMARFAGEDGLTVTGRVVGTPYYMAPEQARGKDDVDIRADLYSLGITLYEMLAGKPPFLGSDPLVVLNKHLNETVRFAFPDVPAELLAIGHRLTERDRARRYATPAELLEDLDALEEDRSLPHARSAVRPRTSRVSTASVTRPSARGPLVWGAAAGALALAVVLAALALPGKPEAPRPAPALPEAARPAPPPPPPPVPARDDPALPEADRTVLAAFARIRQYEADNPGDLEEIAERYAALVDRAAGTAEADTVKRRAADARSALSDAMERRKGAVADEVRAHVRGFQFGAALGTLDRHARDYRSADWKAWVSEERAQVDRSLAAEAQKRRDASRAAEARGDFDGSTAPMKELREFGVPSLAAEATQRLQALEAARRAAEANLARKAEAELARVRTFLDEADGRAAERAYERIEPPALETDGAKGLLKSHLEHYRGAQEVLQTALRHLAGLRGQTVRLVLRDGTSVSGRVEAVQEAPLRLLVGGKAYDALGLSAATVAGFYKGARGPEANAEHLVYFAVFEGDAALADEALKKKPVALEPRYQERLRKAAEEASRAAAGAAAARKEKPPAVKKPEGHPREIVLYACDVPKSSLAKDVEFWDEPASPGGRMLGIFQDGDTKDPLESDAEVLFKASVQSGIPYRFWIHMKVGAPKKRSQSNLFYVQFTQAVDKAGKEIFALGSREYLTVRGPTREGWLWVGRDLADPKSAEPAIYFRAPGEVTIRIAAGMEGVGFDQVVLSPARYLDKPPAEAVVPLPKR